MVLLETAVLEEPHLAGFFLEVGRPGLTEFFNALFPGQGVPIRVSFLEGHLDGGIGYATLPKIKTNAYRAFALIDPGLNEAISEPLITLQAIGSQLSYRLFRNVAVESFVRELPDQLRPPIFAARQEVHGFFPRFKGRRETIFPLVIGEKIADVFVDRLHSNTVGAALYPESTQAANSLGP
jgi:hypothetical protein